MAGWRKWDQVKGLLEADGFEVCAEVREQLDEHCTLMREWNRVVSLVSHGDLDQLEERHVTDSLSLGKWVREGGGSEGAPVVVDVGSGGGFPAVPLKVLVPAMRVVCVERSPRKVGFLVKVGAALGFEGWDVREGQFPLVGGEEAGAVVTARAVEKSARVGMAVGKKLKRSGGVFLCQIPEEAWKPGPMFHVEHVSDSWAELGFRRGTLRIVRYPG